MTKEAKFNSQTLLDLKFEKDVKGYNALQVDQTLDEVISDYKVYESKVKSDSDNIARLIKELNDLKTKNRNLEIELAKAKAEIKAIPTQNGHSVDNVTLLKRIDALERALYKKGVDPKKI